jgi:hypothetical protein
MIERVPLNNLGTRSAVAVAPRPAVQASAAVFRKPATSAEPLPVRATPDAAHYCRRCRVRLISGIASCPVCGACNPNNLKEPATTVAAGAETTGGGDRERSYAAAVAVGLATMVWEIVSAPFRWAFGFVGATVRYILHI